MEKKYALVLISSLLFITVCFTQLACGFKQSTKGKKLNNDQQVGSSTKNTKGDSQSTNANKIATDTKIHYIEMYESICCPRDYKHDIHLLSYIDNFEINNNISLNSNFRLPLGREGEAAYFLSLDNLPYRLQEKFIQNRLKLLKPNDKSVESYLKRPININKALEKWENISTNNLIKF